MNDHEKIKWHLEDAGIPDYIPIGGRRSRRRLRRQALANFASFWARFENGNA